MNGSPRATGGLVALALLAIIGLAVPPWTSEPARAQAPVNTIGVGASPLRVALHESANRLYVVNNGATTVSAINTSTDSVAATLTLSSTPLGVAVNTTLNRAIVSQANGNLAVINTTNDTLITDAAFC